MKNQIKLTQSQNSISLKVFRFVFIIKFEERNNSRKSNLVINEKRRQEDVAGLDDYLDFASLKSRASQMKKIHN